MAYQPMPVAKGISLDFAGARKNALNNKAAKQSQVFNQQRIDANTLAADNSAQIKGIRSNPNFAGLSLPDQVNALSAVDPAAGQAFAETAGKVAEVGYAANRDTQSTTAAADTSNAAGTKLQGDQIALQDVQRVNILQTLARLPDYASFEPTLRGLIDDPNNDFSQTDAASFFEQANLAKESGASWPEFQEQLNQTSLTTAEKLDARIANETERNNRFKNENPTSGTTINVGSGNEEQKAYGKHLVKTFEGVQEAADIAFTANRELEMLRNIDVNQGAGESFKANIASWGIALGVDPSTLGLPDPTNAQSYIALSKKMLLSAMAAQKGPQTEADMKVIADTIAKLDNQNEANQFIIDASIAVNNRRIAKAKFFDQRMTDKGTFKGANSAWSTAMGKTPFMAPNAKTGRPVFYDQWLKDAGTNNPGMSPADLREQWRTSYGN